MKQRIDMKNKVNELSKTCYEKDDSDSWHSNGVLLSHDIADFASRYNMIVPFDKDQLKPAGYYLSIGKEYAINGKIYELSDKISKNIIDIPPFQVVIIQTDEIINLPRFIIARWNLRVTYVYKGLLWTGALQVDPGWCGQLSCPIYNLSNEPVRLRYKEQIVLMDFVKTTPLRSNTDINYVKKLKRPLNHLTLDQYNYSLKSALFTEAKEKVESLDSKMSRFEAYIGLIFACIAILFAGLTILVTSFNSSSTSNISFWNIVWIAVAVTISLASLFISTIKLSYSFIQKKKMKIIFSIFLLILALILAYLIYPQTFSIIYSTL